MNKDFRILVTLPTHPKAIKLMRKYGDRSFYNLIRLWAYVAQNKPDGVLTGMDDDDIEIAADWNGEPGMFVKALLDDSIRFLDSIGGVYQIHDWEDHNEYASHAVERSAIASNAAKARWRGRSKRAEHAAKDPKRARSMQRAMPGACREQCPEHAESNAPSPSPSPSPSPKNVLSKESPPTSGGKVERLPTKKKKPGHLKHYSANVGELIEGIRSRISVIEGLSVEHGWRFNVHAWVQQKANIRGHPKAIHDSLGWLIDHADEAKNPWSFTDSSFENLNPKYNEQDHIAESEKFKKLWAEEFRPLVDKIGNG